MQIINLALECNWWTDTDDSGVAHYQLCVDTDTDVLCLHDLLDDRFFAIWGRRLEFHNLEFASIYATKAAAALWAKGYIVAAHGFYDIYGDNETF